MAVLIANLYYTILAAKRVILWLLVYSSRCGRPIYAASVSATGFLTVQYSYIFGWGHTPRFLVPR